MQEVELTLANLRELDLGRVNEAFAFELAHVVKDCLDRTTDDRARKVTLTFLLVPSQDTTRGAHACDTVDVGAEITSSVPKRRSKIYTMEPRVNGGLTFHPESPSDPNANKLYDHIDRETGEVKE